MRQQLLGLCSGVVRIRRRRQDLLTLGKAFFRISHRGRRYLGKRRGEFHSTRARCPFWFRSLGPISASYGQSWGQSQGPVHVVFGVWWPVCCRRLLQLFLLQGAWWTPRPKVAPSCAIASMASTAPMLALHSARRFVASVLRRRPGSSRSIWSGMPR